MEGERRGCEKDGARLVTSLLALFFVLVFLFFYFIRHRVRSTSSVQALQ